MYISYCIHNITVLKIKIFARLGDRELRFSSCPERIYRVVGKPTSKRAIQSLTSLHRFCNAEFKAGFSQRQFWFYKLSPGLNIPRLSSFWKASRSLLNMASIRIRVFLFLNNLSISFIYLGNRKYMLLCTKSLKG